MAWRPHEKLIDGELCNVKRGQVTGHIRFLGMNEPVVLSLQGDFHRDIRGTTLRLTGNPDYADVDKSRIYMQGFSTVQQGHVGDITVGGVPCDYVDYPYIEWFSETNGRVVLELERGQVAIVGKPLPWQNEEPRDPRIAAARVLQFLSDVARDFVAKQ
jgi:hypothetical protein